MTHQQQKASSPIERVTLVLVMVTLMIGSLYGTWWVFEGWFGGRAAVWLTLMAQGGAVAAADLRARRLSKQHGHD